jgi:hypothetical protein
MMGVKRELSPFALSGPRLSSRVVVDTGVDFSAVLADDAFACVNT